jgi:hypothetical protein
MFLSTVSFILKFLLAILQLTNKIIAIDAHHIITHLPFPFPNSLPIRTAFIIYKYQTIIANSTLFTPLKKRNHLQNETAENNAQMVLRHFFEKHKGFQSCLLAWRISPT